MLSSIKELDEHQKLYVMMCVKGSSPSFPSNLGMFYGSLSSMTSHEGLWEIGSFVRHAKSCKSKIARKGNDV
jgi:hypothetical protein